MNADRVWERLGTHAPHVLAALLAACAAWVAWISDRGFDISDEGFYLLGARYPADLRAFPSMGHYYVGLLYGWVGHDVHFLRLAGLALVLAAAAVFALGLHRLLAALLPRQAASASPLAAYSLIGLGALLYYSWPPPTPSYNLIVACGVTASAGLFCAALGALEAREPRSTAWLFPCGALAALTFYAKFPAGIALTGAYVLVLLLWPGVRLSQRLAAIAAVAGGFLAWALLHFATLQAPGEWWTVFSNGIELGRRLGSGHGAGLIVLYTQQVAGILTGAFERYGWAYALVLAAFVAARRWPADDPRLRAAGRYATLALLAVLAFRAWQEQLYLGGHQAAGYLMQFYAAWTLLFLLAIGLTAWCWRGPLADATGAARGKLALLALLLATLPWAGAFGTNNPLPANALLAMAPGCGLLVLLAALARGPAVDEVSVRLALLVIGGLAAVQVISAPVVGPYRLAAGILQQEVPTGIGAPPSWLKLDPATSEFFAKMRAIAAEQGFRPGDDVLGFVRVPGVVYALGGRSPGIAWYTSHYPGAQEHNEAGLALAPRERLRRAFILETTGAAEAMPRLAGVGLEFPRDYVLGGEAVWPVTGVTVRFWRPRAR